jgi:hypothetical protein
MIPIEGKNTTMAFNEQCLFFIKPLKMKDRIQRTLTLHHVICVRQSGSCYQGMWLEDEIIALLGIMLIGFIIGIIFRSLVTGVQRCQKRTSSGRWISLNFYNYTSKTLIGKRRSNI